MISIIICTCNRAAHLEETLAAMEHVQVSDGIGCELLVVDNASTDNTRAVVEAARLSQMPIRYIYEPKRGQSNARNRGMAEAEGEVFLWTDDDVRPPRNWIEGMCQPILEGDVSAVGGGVRMAPHLVQLWQTEVLHGWLAVAPTRFSSEGWVGANMSFSRRVLEQVPAFDAELGPGQIGFGDDTLFALQIKTAGLKMGHAWDTAVEHHFEAARMERVDLLQSGPKRGEAMGYIAYHWEHQSLPKARVLLLKRRLRLQFERVRRHNEIRVPQGLPDWEATLIGDIGYLRQFIKESRRPRQYEKFGMVKLSHR